MLKPWLIGTGNIPQEAGGAEGLEGENKISID